MWRYKQTWAGRGFLVIGVDLNGEFFANLPLANRRCWCVVLLRYFSLIFKKIYIFCPFFGQLFNFNWVWDNFYSPLFNIWFFFSCQLAAGIYVMSLKHFITMDFAGIVNCCSYYHLQNGCLVTVGVVEFFELFWFIFWNPMVQLF